MLVPEQASEANTKGADTNINMIIDQAITTKLTQQLNQVVAVERVFDQCERVLCGQSTVQEVLSEVAKRAPDVDLVLFYGLFKSEDNTSLRVSLIDPLSFQRYASFDINVLSGALASIEQAHIKSLSADLGDVISQRLQNVVKRSDFALKLEGFSIDEVAPLSTFILAATLDTKLTLTKSEKQSAALDAYFPTMETHFAVTSGLTPSQFNQLLQSFFKSQSIPVITEYQRDSNAFLVLRLGNPYTPSFISSLLMIMTAVLFIVLLIKRQIYQHQLEHFAQSKSVDRWLNVYEKAKSPWFALHKKWGNQHNYWQRLQRESNELEKQAKLFFDAGDAITAKLFVTKALNLNADASIANALVDKITNQESSQQALTKKEQWLRNKVAKAMNNYRSNQPIKALRQAYQALYESAAEKKLKRQHKAIKRLLQKINTDFLQNHYHIQLTDLSSSEVCVVSVGSEIALGRYPATSSDDASSLYASSAMGFYINHKALSRMGKHCRLLAREDGFFVEDMGSTNGTFLRANKVEKNSAQRLVHEDTIYLGANSELSAVKLDVSISSRHSLLQISVSKQLMHTIDMVALARVWPEHMHAMRTSLVLTRSNVVVAIDGATNKLEILSAAEFQTHAEAIGLVKITLGQGASLAPLPDVMDKDTDTLWCNGEKLLGVVPLLLPCEIKYQQQHVLMDEYLPLGFRRASADSVPLLYSTQDNEPI